MRFFLLLALALLAGCATGPAPTPVTDLLAPVRLQAGQADTLLVADLFYAPDYTDLEVASADGVGATYLTRSGRLVLAPTDDHAGLALVTLRLGGQALDLPTVTERFPTRTITFTPGRAPGRVNLFGSFNGWDRAAQPMTDADADGTYEATVALAPGSYQYKFFVDGAEVLDPATPDSVPNGIGGHNHALTVPAPPPARLHLLGGAPASGPVEALRFAYDRAGATPLAADEVVALLGNQRLPADHLALDADRFTLTLPEAARTGEAVVRVAVDQDGQPTNWQTVRLFDGRPAGADGTPATWHDTVLYSLMIDRFHDGDPTNTQPVDHAELDPMVNYHGGDLEGVLEQIKAGYFDSLGVNTLWLSPVYQNPLGAYREFPEPHRYITGYHGYWPIDNESVDQRFGDLALLREVVDAAHARDMRVMLDFVANHVHEENPLLAEHPDWFGEVNLPDGRKNIRLWDEQRLTTWFDVFLPSVDYSSPEALEAFTDNVIWWVEQTGVDGFRHDAVKHIPNDVWRTTTRKLREQVEAPQGRSLYQIGETFGSYDLIGSYVNHGQLDGQFDFNLYDAALATFLDPDAGFDGLDAALRRSHAVYGTNHLMGNLMDSHDKVRFMALAEGDVPYGQSDGHAEAWSADTPQVDDPATYRRAQLYLAYLMTIPGVPTIYYGDEIGLTGAADPDNRRPMRFGDALADGEQAMLEATRQIVQLRRAHPALRYGDFEPLHVGADTYAYLRSDLNERVLVVLNKSQAATDVRVPLPPAYDLTRATDAAAGTTLPLTDDTLTVRLPADGWRVLVVE